MSNDKFIRSMNTHLQELESIADDLDELGSDEKLSYVQQQAILNKAARTYEVLETIRHDLRRFEVVANGE